MEVHRVNPSALDGMEPALRRSGAGCLRPEVGNVQIVGHLRAAMESGGKTADYNEIDTCVAQRLNSLLELH